MASTPQRETLDLDLQIARIEKTQAKLGKILMETKLATPQTFFQEAIAMAALIGAGVLLAKLVF